MLSIKEINLLQAQNEGLKKQNADLQKENAKLKEEIEIRDNLSEKFRKEALSWANIANEYQKDRTKLEQTLQKIKEIAEAPKLFIDFSETKTVTEVEYDYAVICNELELRLHKVLELITKAESEDNQ